MTEIEAIDGEAIDGQYRLMCCSDGRGIGLVRELFTREVFDWLAQGKARYCCFGLGYDVNMWLRDLPVPHLRRLWETGGVAWNGWRIEWIPSKLIVARHVASGRSFRVEECWGYFQKPFLEALELWDIPCPDVIGWGKRERASFEAHQLDMAMSYCMAECVALKELMAKVRECAARIGLRPRSWIGPGSLASELMRVKGVRDHRVPDHILFDKPELVRVMSAYFGGRVEAYAQGRWAKVWAYDISSAYPAAMLSLPRLENARPQRTDQLSFEFSVCRCRWDVPGRVGPFPVRQSTAIWYPAAGEGWYHGSEVEQASLSFPEHVQVQECLSLEGDIYPPSPFEWVPEVYAERVRLLRAGDMSGQMLKLALNSCYGKLAQSRGRARSNGKPEVPKWRQFWWAGEITAATRARILQLIRIAGQVPLAISTDGIVFEKPVDVRTVKGELGDWEESEYENFCLLGPGIYSYEMGGKRFTRSRGFFGKEVDWDRLAEDILRGCSYQYTSRRFIGLGASLARKDMSKWRTWEDDPDRRIVSRIDRRERRADGLLWPIKEFMVSEPYRPADKSIDLELDELMDQPEIA